MIVRSLEKAQKGNYRIFCTFNHCYLLFKWYTIIRKEREIWMLRYGLMFEDIEWASDCIDSIDESEIVFNNRIKDFDESQLKSIEQYLS